MNNPSQSPPRKKSGPSFKEPRKSKEIRQRICDAAARIMIEEGINDFQHAKRKASSRLNIRQNFLLPSNKEIEVSLQERLQLFANESTLGNLNNYRQTAIDIMEFLAPFQPRIVGGILEDYVTPSSSISLHLFAQSPEEIWSFLTEHQISFHSVDKRFRYDRDRVEYIPVLQLGFKDISIEGAIFSSKGLRQAPRSPVHGNPMERLTVEQLRLRTKSFQQ